MLPEDNFSESASPPLPCACMTQRCAQGYLTSLSAPGLSNEPSQSGSFSSPETPKQTISSFRIMTIKRGFTDEADQLLNCLVLARDVFLRSPHIPSGARYIRCLGTPVPQKLCVRDLSCELSLPPVVNTRLINLVRTITTRTSWVLAHIVSLPLIYAHLVSSNHTHSTSM